MRNLLSIALVLATMAFAGLAQAETISKTFQPRKDHYTPKGWISLKSELKKNFKNEFKDAGSFEDYHLQKVIVFAKSRAGKGTATLEIEMDGKREDQQTKTVAKGKGRSGASDDQLFKNGKFNRIKLVNQQPDDLESWRIRLEGSIKVEKVKLVMERRIVRVVETLNYRHRVYAPEGVLRIKKMLMNQRGYGDDELDGMRLLHVVVKAKSYTTDHSDASTATLTVDGRTQDGEYVAMGRETGGRWETDYDIFRNDNPESYRRHRLTNYSNSRGTWRVYLEGEIKVYKVKVVMESR